MSVTDEEGTVTVDIRETGAWEEHEGDMEEVDEGVLRE
jgi:hypothetical protein